MQIDATDAVAIGTSMASPQAAGAAALLFEKDPTLTQDKVTALLQAGAHAFRTGTPEFEDQGGPGELDVQGALDALEQVRDPAMALPSKGKSWITPGAGVVMADGSTPLTCILELRTADGLHRADFFDASRLAAVLELDGQTMAQPPPLQRRAPGLWFFTLTPPAGLGGRTLTVGATFDGAPIVTPVRVPIATDIWTANYPATTAGSRCSFASTSGQTRASGAWPWVLLAGMTLRRRRRRRRG
jgi:MYXO-CTERM domain-containing protein